MLTPSIAALLGFAIGILLCYFYFRRQLDFQKQGLVSQKEIELNSLHHEQRSLKSSIEDFENKVIELSSVIQDSQLELQEVKEERAVLKERLQQERQQSQDKLNLLEDNKRQLKLEFESLAQKILDQSSKKMVDKNRDELDNILKPLRQHLDHFEKRYLKDFKRVQNSEFP